MLPLVDLENAVCEFRVEMSLVFAWPIYFPIACMLCIVTEMKFQFHGPLACVMHYIICFIQPSSFISPQNHTHLFFTQSLYAFSQSTSCFLNLTHIHSQSSKMYAQRHFILDPMFSLSSFSFPYKHTHISSPAYLAALSMSLTF